MTNSFWETDTLLRKADLVIIGSGIVGLSAALAARRADASLRIVVVERGTLPSGASTRNAGFACFGSMTELLADLATRSENEVFGLVERRYAGLMRLRERVGDAALGYEQHGGYELFTTNDAASFAICSDKIADFNRQLAHITKVKNTYQINAKYLSEFRNIIHSIWNCAEGQIDTGAMMNALLRQAAAADIQILNALSVREIQEQSDEITLFFDNEWQLRAAQILVCTNGFTKRLLPNLDVQAARNQVLITEPIEGLNLKGCFHYQEGYYYFRNVGNRILLGGGRNLDYAGEATDEFGQTEIIQNALLNLLHQTILPNKKVAVAQWWSGILGIGDSKSPIIERLSPRLSVAVRMGGMGVAIGALVGEEGADLALNG